MVNDRMLGHRQPRAVPDGRGCQCCILLSCLQAPKHAPHHWSRNGEIRTRVDLECRGKVPRPRSSQVASPGGGAGRKPVIDAWRGLGRRPVKARASPSSSDGPGSGSLVGIGASVGFSPFLGFAPEAPFFFFLPPGFDAFLGDPIVAFRASPICSRKFAF